MLTFKEFVLASWEARGSPTGLQAEKTFLVWMNEDENNGWWVRYNAWKNHGCPMPVKDINYDKIPVSVSVPTPGPVNPTLTLEEFYATSLNAVLNKQGFFKSNDFKTEHISVQEDWIASYEKWIAKGCPEIKPKVFNTKSSQPKKQIRYLNRV